jgi:rhodanese-related sulfurtransferase
MNISVQELKQRMNQGEQDFLLLDVREDAERAAGNIGGLHIPMGFVLARLGELEDYQDQEVIVYCRSGGRSSMVQQLLLGRGFSNVKNLTGGMMAWEAMQP